MLPIVPKLLGTVLEAIQMVVPMAPPMNGAGAPNAAPPFDKSTRLSLVPLAAITRPAGGGASPDVELPSNGLDAGIFLEIRGTVGGTVGAVNALGMASIVKRITVRLNTGTVIWSMSGASYHYLYRNMIDAGYVDIAGYTNARSAVTATGAIVDMFIPFTINQRDAIGILLAQNRQTAITLTVEWEADATVTATGTFTSFYCKPHLVVFSVPPNPLSLPQNGLRWMHVITDETKVISGAGDDAYDIPRGNTYMRIIHGVGIGVSGADSWTRAVARVNQTQYIWDMIPNSADMVWWLNRGRTRPPGVIVFDFMGTSGLGNYGTTRDLYDSNKVTDFQTVVTITGALTRYTVREQLVDLGPIDFAQLVRR